MIRLVIILTIGFMPTLIQAQKLTFGLGAFSAVGLDNIETKGDLVYHFSDDANSSYTLKSNKALSKSGLYPKAYMQYMMNDNWYFNYEFGFLYYKKAFDIAVKNDVLQSDHVAQYTYSFLSNTLLLGRKFARKRVVKPKLFGGASALSLVGFKESSKTSNSQLLANDGIPGKILHQQISSINNYFLNACVGFGLEYYFLNIDFIYDRSVLKIDNEKYQPFYDKYQAFYVSVGIDLANIIPNGSKKVTSYPSYWK